MKKSDFWRKKSEFGEKKRKKRKKERKIWNFASFGWNFPEGLKSFIYVKILKKISEEKMRNFGKNAFWNKKGTVLGVHGWSAQWVLFGKQILIFVYIIIIFYFLYNK